MEKIQLSKRQLSYQWLPNPGKPTLVFTHALGMHQGAWQPVVERLTPDFSVLTWDLPGHGHSEGFSSTETVTPQGLVQELMELIQHLNISHFSFVGTSIGGAVGLALLQTHASRLNTLLLTNTGAVIGRADTWYERCELIRQQGLPSMAENIVPRWFSQASVDKSDGQLVVEWQRVLADTDQISYIKLCEMLAVTDLRQVTSSGVSVGLVAGEDDLATPPASLEALSRQLRVAAPVVLKQIGHIPSIEAPDALVAEIIKYNTQA